MRLLEAKRVGMPKKLYNANHWIFTWLDLRILLTFKKQNVMLNWVQDLVFFKGLDSEIEHLDPEINSG